jgi:eukaryotic-like serine/threonine-protein kinase
MSPNSLLNPVSPVAADSRKTAPDAEPGRVGQSVAASVVKDRSVLEEIIEDPNLPSPPSVALQLVELASNPDADIREVVRVLNVDPAICAKLLKTVNSSFYGLRKPIASVERAVSIVGFRGLRSLVLGMVAPSLGGGGGAAGEFRAYWLESLSGAVTARELALRARHPMAEEIFLAGLLRDLGKLLLRQRFGDRYAPAWTGVTRLWGEREVAWEAEALGVDHAELSAALLARWRLPEEIVRMVRHHHDPEPSAEVSPLCRHGSRILQFGSLVARVENVPEDEEAVGELIRRASDFGMSPANLERLLGEVSPKVEEFAAILDVEVAPRARRTGITGV